VIRLQLKVVVAFELSKVVLLISSSEVEAMRRDRREVMNECKFTSIRAASAQTRLTAVHRQHSSQKSFNHNEATEHPPSPRRTKAERTTTFSLFD
jgi:hypothetical protein